MLTRRHDWQSALCDYLLRSYAVPFKYGEHDCGLFAAGAIEAMTGVDVAAQLRGRYKSRSEARAAMNAATLEAFVEQLLPEVPVQLAQRGDLVVLTSWSVGIVAMHGTDVLTTHKDGIVRIPLSEARRAFHI